MTAKESRDAQIALALEEMKKRHNFEDGNDDQLISYLEQIRSAFLNFCHIPCNAKLPDGLFYCWVDATLKYIDSNHFIETESETATPVKSITEGDEKIEFAISESKSNYSVDEIVEENKRELYEYRRFC